ncbi:TD and POZ domain-containing protein 3 [Folsomia candida]|uniref:TD and POZ domain-containing protein 3 n=1 Tax=Folsomia candida TaxID=158441 RepID=A0A226DVQ9_FOLCA|nr:TD and POZ domain-containing protein 3 [Folsomia candida]
MASSPDVIPRDRLKILEIFRDVGPEGEGILKTAKLAHLCAKHGVVVTTKDETYSFVRATEGGGCTISRIPNLCGLRVKEGKRQFKLKPRIQLHLNSLSTHQFYFNLIKFVLLIDGLGFLITEEGSLYCLLLWEIRLKNKSSDVPLRLMGGNLAGNKVKQVALRGTHILTLTESGNVYHNHIHNIRDSNLIPKNNFDSQEVISIACTADGLDVALTSNGELFQWGQDKLPKKVIFKNTAEFKKIVAISHMIFALALEGTLYSGSVVLPWGDFGASCSLISPRVTTSLDEFFAEISQTTWRTISAKSLLKPVTLGDDIADLWENSDVVFSVEGKTISGHKCILACRSEYFAKMFNNEWKEAQEGCVIEIKDTDNGGANHVQPR